MRIPVSSLLAKALRRDIRGVSIVEFALALPLLLFGTLGGLETAHLVITRMRVNQIATSLADNASRMKQQTVSGAPKVREYDVNEAFKAAERQGDDLNLLANGRMIVSSLEYDPVGKRQWFQWQRCQGSKTSYTSDFGKQQVTIAGVRGPGGLLTAEPDAAIMVAEVIYQYQPLIMADLFKSFEIRQFKAMYVRDDRDLSKPGIWNLEPKAGVSNC